ncbi:hypothetical protein [Streptomyces sp. NBC_01538]|uniref:hypothetical protein n=1 Tax=Streptomyces sp. NBC_01538 TaxID=2903897 RepID=UPI00386CABF7
MQAAALFLPVTVAVVAVEAFAKALRADGKVPHIWTANPHEDLTNSGNAADHWSRRKAEFPNSPRRRST